MSQYLQQARFELLRKRLNKFYAEIVATKPKTKLHFSLNNDCKYIQRIGLNFIFITLRSGRL